MSVQSLYGELLPPSAVPTQVREDLSRTQLDHGTFKVNWALERPIPWLSEESRLAGTVHVAGGLDELSESSLQLVEGRIPARPFLLVGQYSQADPTRAPAGKESAWAYTHVPQMVSADAGGDLTGDWPRDRERFADRMEKRIEAVAPGFRRSIRGRSLQAPPDLERADRNLIGGALNGGTAQLHQQLLFRPVPGLGARTPVKGLYLASASAHPGGGVHGGPGAIAARAAIASRRRDLGRLLSRVRPSG